MTQPTDILRSKFGHRLLALFVLSALLPTILVAVFALRNVSRQLDEQTRSRLHETSKSLGIAMYGRLRLLEAQLKSRARNPPPFQGTRAMVTPGLDDLLHGQFLALEAIARPELSQDAERFLATGQTMLSTEHPPGLSPRLYLTRRLKPGDDSPSVLVGEIDPNFLWGLPDGTGLAEGTDLIVLDDSGRVLYSSLPEPTVFPAEARSLLAETSSGAFDWQPSAQPSVAAFWTLFLKPAFFTPKWTVVLSESREGMLAPLTTFKSTFLPVILLSLLLVVFISLSQIRRSLLPLRALQEAARRIANREFDSPASVVSGDEFQELAGAFNAMAAHLGRQFSTLATAAQIDRAVLSALKVDTIVDTVLRRLPEACPCEGVIVTLLELPAGGDAQTRFLTGQPRNAASEVVRLSMDDLEDLSNGEPLSLALNPALPGYLRPLVDQGSTSFVVLPLRFQGELFGLIALGHQDIAAPSGDDLMQARHLADQVAVALSNARMIASLAEVNQALRGEVAERARAESALRLSEEQFRQSQKMEAIGTLAGGVAHDFNNLLTVILSYSQFAMAELEADAPMRADIKEIAEAANRASALTKQLLAFSRKQVMRLELLDLNLIVAGIEKMLGRLIGADIEMRIHRAATLGSVKADSGQLDQVIMNLVVNARDAMPRGGQLTLETSNVRLEPSEAERHGATPGDWVMLAVGDSGVGMDEATRLRIFEPFFTTKAPGKGTGLGLSTVYGIVRQSGGFIAVESSPGRGATFKIFLPAVEESEETSGPSLAESGDGAGSETVLLVEDEEPVRELAQRILRRSGYHVVAASHGNEAVQAADTYDGPIHLLLTDVVLPYLSGPELAARLRPSRPEMRVLFMSGYTEEAVAGRSGMEGGVNLLQKPFVPEQLARRVRAVLDSPASGGVDSPGPVGLMSSDRSMIMQKVSIA